MYTPSAMSIEGPDERKHLLTRKLIKVQEYAAMTHRLVEFFLAEQCPWRAVEAQVERERSYHTARVLMQVEEPEEPE